MNVPRKLLQALLIEDSQDDADLTLFELDEGGFDVTHERVDTEPAMRAALAHGGWSVVISDFNLPQFCASKALSILREEDEDTPFIVVSACIGEEQAVALMKQGASDFVMKDRLARLAPAIERELRDAAVRREHRKAQEALRASEKLLSTIASALGEGVYVLDREGKLIFMNPEAERLLGWKQEELLGKEVHPIIHSQRQDGTPLPEHECIALNVMKHGNVLRSEDNIFWRKDGSPINASITASAIVENGKATASVAVFQDISQRKLAESQLKESRQQLQELSAYLQTVREEERARIARELHDELGQMLTGVKLDAKWLAMHIPEGNSGLASKVASMSELIDQTLDAMRRVAADLRPTMLDDLGLEAAIEWLVEDFSKRAGVKIQLEMRLTDKHGDCPLGAEAATAVFRIVQESLTNAARYAQAKQVMVSLECDGGKLLLMVSDDGKGMDPAGGRANSLGLVGMRERVYNLGGEFSFFSKPGKGTTISVSIPVDQICTWRAKK